jgi:hypothetical protein
MNPPFTRKERLTSGMKSIQWSFLGDQNYWAYFIPLADSLLKKKGKIAAVLPRDFFRGEYSRAVRQYLFKDRAYSLKYVVKTTKETAFSENARFRDFLIVLEKGGSRSKCAFIYLKKKLFELNMREASGIPLTIRQLEEGKIFEDESVFVTWQSQSEISDSYRDLGQLVTFNTKAGESLLIFYKHALSKAATRVTRLSESKTPISVLRGLEPSVENLLNLIFVVRPIHKDRISRSELILSYQGGKTGATLKDSPVFFEIPAKTAKKGLKTAAYVPSLDVDSISDLAILKPFDGLQEIQNKLGIGQVDFKDVADKAKHRMSHLLLSRRFNFAAPGTKAFAFFCSDKALGGKAFWTFSTDLTESKILCVWLNGTLAFIESLLLQSETEGSFVEVTKEKLLEFHIPDLVTCDTSKLLAAFERVRRVEFPPIIEQFENPPEARKIIDRAVFKTIGYSDKETEEILPELYKAIATELRSWKELMHQSSAKEKEPTPQLHLFAKE